MTRYLLNMIKRPLIVYGPFSTPHTESWVKLINQEDYLLKGITLHSGNSSIPVFSADGKLGKFRFALGSLLLFFLFIRNPRAIVLAHYYSSYGLSAMLSMMRPIIFCWGSDVNLLHSKFPRIANVIGKLANKRARKIIVPSQAISQKLVSSGVCPEKIHILQYGIDISEIKNYLRPALVHAEGVHIASIRNGDALYQIDKIIEAFKQAHFGEQKATLHIFGSGHAYPEGQRELGSDKTVIHHGYLPKDRFYQYLSGCDAFVSIPTRDGLSLSVLEALYLGLTPILSDVGSYRELFSVLNPWFADATASTETLAHLLSKAIHDSTLATENSHRAQQVKAQEFLESNFSMDDARQKLASILFEASADR